MRDATAASTAACSTRWPAIWLVPAAQRSADTVQVAQWDEEFHCALVAAAGNAEMARVHRDVTDRIRIIRRLDFTKQPRIDATYEEHAKILKAIRANRGDQAAMLLRAHIETSQAEVRKITLHQVHLARHAGRNSDDAGAERRLQREVVVHRDRRVVAELASVL